MIVLKILAAPFVVALTLLVAIVSFLYCVASALCHIGCVVLTLLALVLFIGRQTLGGVVFLVLAFLVSPFGIPAIADWLMDLNYIDVLREVGAHFSVNRMLTAECYKQRMEKGLSFLEFNYMIMQSYDFYTLYQKYGCNMEFGGDDQWSNMLGGTELIRRKLGKDAYAMTINLLLNSEGKKMGKTQSGAVWLDPEKTSPFDFFQYWRNVADSDVLKCIRMLTFLPLEEIDAMESWEGAQLNQAKEILAFELTKLVHGEEEATKAREASHALFAGGGDSAHMPTVELSSADFADGDMDILSLLVKTELAPSRSDARRAVEQGGVSVADEKVTDIKTAYNADSFGADGLVVKRGKKKFVKVVVK